MSAEISARHPLFMRPKRERGDGHAGDPAEAVWYPFTMASAYESIAERRIREAKEAGEFEATEGVGEPLADLDKTRKPGWWTEAFVAREKKRTEELDAADTDHEAVTAWRRVQRTKRP